MDIRVTDSRFEAVEDGKVVGSLDWRDTPQGVALTHTVVDGSHSRQAVGTALATAALDHVEAEGREVLPYCSFVRTHLADHPERIGLVPEDRRAEFGLAGKPLTGDEAVA